MVQVDLDALLGLKSPLCASEESLKVLRQVPSTEPAVWEGAVTGEVWGLVVVVVVMGSSVRGAGRCLVGGDGGRRRGQGRGVDGGEPGGLRQTRSRVSRRGRQAGSRGVKRRQLGEGWTGSRGVGDLRVGASCGGFGHLSGWLLALEITRASVLKPNLWERKNHGYVHGTLWRRQPQLYARRGRA